MCTLLEGQLCLGALGFLQSSLVVSFGGLHLGFVALWGSLPTKVHPVYRALGSSLLSFLRVRVDSNPGTEGCRRNSFATLKSLVVGWARDVTCSSGASELSL